MVEWDFMGFTPLVIKHGNGKSQNWMEVSTGKALRNGPVSIAMFDYWKVSCIADRHILRLWFMIGYIDKYGIWYQTSQWLQLLAVW